HHEPADAQPAGADRHAEAAAAVTAAAVVAAILDVVAGLPIVGAHRRSSCAREHIPSVGNGPRSALLGAGRVANRYPSRRDNAANLHIVSKPFTRHGAQSFR